MPVSQMDPCSERTSLPPLHGETIPERLKSFAEAVPDRLALKTPRESLSFGELDVRAARIAAALQALGIGSGHRIALLAEPSAAEALGFLAILQTGASYVALTPSHPLQRNSGILADCRPSLLLYDVPHQDLARSLTGPGLPCLALVELEKDGTCDWRPSRIDPDAPASLMYSSGSTGTPKGILHTHRSTLKLGQAAAERNFEREDRVLVAGATLAFNRTILQGVSSFPWLLMVDGLDGLAEWIRRQRLTVFLGVPSSFRVVARSSEAAQSLTTFRVVILTGETLHRKDGEQFRSCLSPECVIVNELGSNETKSYAQYRIDASTTLAEEIVPVGEALPGKTIRLLNEAGQECGVDEVGEIVVSMADLPPGYWQRPDLSAECFLPWPPGTPLSSYRTGDRGRWRADGLLVHCGRSDWQCKIRGQKVELMEVEAALASLDGIEEAAVVAEAQEEEILLFAYFTTTQEPEPDPSTLRRQLAERLPSFMLPGRWIALPEMPRTATGKIDRRALPRLPAPARSPVPFEQPGTQTERILASLWAEMLGLSSIGRHDNFFELGGHSLLAVLAAERLRSHRLHLDVGTLFAAPTLAEAAAAARPLQEPVEEPAVAIPPGCSRITSAMLPLVRLEEDQIERICRAIPGGAANIQDIYPLTALQEGILFHSRLEQDNDPYTLGTIQIFADRSALDRHLSALQAVIDRHDILRTAVIWEGLEEPVQVVQRNARLPVQELSPPATGRPAVDALQAFLAGGQARLAPAKAPMLQVFLMPDRSDSPHCDEPRWFLLQLVHHLINDQTSTKVLEEEVEAHCSGWEALLPPAAPFRAVVARNLRALKHADPTPFFRTLLAGVEEPTFPFGLTDVRIDGSTLRDARIVLEPELVSRLRERARQAGVSPASLCHLAWALVVARATGRDDVVFGTLLFGRLQGEAEASRVMGPCINTLPVRLVIGQQGVQEALRGMHRLLAELMQHEHAPLSLALKCSDVPQPGPLFSCLFNYRYRDRSQPATIQSAAPLLRRARSSYPLLLSVEDQTDHLALRAQVQPPVPPETICRAMATALEQVVERLERKPHMPLLELDVLPPEERQLLDRWSRGPQTGRNLPGVNALFTARVQAFPEAPALVSPAIQLSYRQLEEWVGALAAHLLRMGICQENVVGVVIPRSAELVVALLAILRVGATYLPLDPALPAQRLKRIAEDAEPALILTTEDPWPWKGAQLRVDHATAEPFVEATRPETDPLQTAYLLYTSGSTGTPKGVVMPHRCLNNLLAFHAEDERLGSAARTLQFAATGFDVSIQEILVTLTAGGCLVMASEKERRDPRLLWQLIRRERIERLFLPYVVLEQLALNSDSSPCCLQDVVCAGESLVLSPPIRRFFTDKPTARLHNHYGPTETHVVTAHRLGPEPADWPAVAPIGRPLPGVRVEVRDPLGRPSPVGVAGELHIGGTGLANGYLNNPKLTAKTFIPDPFSAEPTARLYKTGDLAAWQPDGTLSFHGRLDQQIKLRGFRIEPGEIEANLLAHPAVAQAVVNLSTDDPDNQRLIAYWVRNADIISSITATELRSFLAERLPDYMVPAAIEELAALPLTTNGKIDRKALPAASLSGNPQQGVPPSTALQIQLHRIWSEVLGHADFGIEDNFFALGGHSIAAARLLTRIEQSLSTTLPLATIFHAPSVAQMAQVLQEQKNLNSTIDPCLVPLQPLGGTTPLFVIHGYAGDVFCYTDFARALTPERPVFGLQAQGSNGQAPLHRSVEAMADHYASLIQQRWPQGPYHLVGQSAGGWYAYAVAAALLKRGGSIGMLAILDSGATASIAKRLRASLLLRRTLRRFPEYIEQLLHSKRPSSLVSFLRLRFRNLSAHLAWFLTSAKHPRQDLDDRAAPNLLDTYDVLHRHYHPQPLPLTIDLFTTPKGARLKQRLWRAHACGGVRHRILFQEHYHYHHPPWAADLAAAIRDTLEYVEGDQVGGTALPPADAP